MTVSAIVAAVVMFYIGRRYGEHRAYDRVSELTAEVGRLARRVAESDPIHGLRVITRDPD